MTANQQPILRTALMLAVVTVAGLQMSCALPPKEAWRRIKDEGVLKALFMPKSRQVDSSRVAANTSWGSADAGGSRVADAGAPAVPTAETFTGRAGFVYSPHTSPKKLVNVSGFRAGEQVLCPYTLEAFVVPDFGQSLPSNNTAIVDAAPKTKDRSTASNKTTRKEPTDNAVDVVSTDISASMLPTTGGLPTGNWVEGRPGFVYSPFAAKHQLVDVTGIAPGVEVKCPYTGKIFRVPEMPGGSSIEGATPPAPKIEPKPEPKSEPKPKMEPKPEPKVENKPQPKPEALPEPKAEPKPEPAPTVTPAPTTPAPAADPSLPTAKWDDSARGLVQSPFGQPGELVDVTGKAPGAKVICPFTGKAFLVPVKP